MNRTVSKRVFWLCFFGFTSVTPSITFTQETDSTKGEVYSTVTDPVQNRLFWMSTGRVSEPYRFSLGTFELFVLQAGYTPTKYFQLNLSGTFRYWSVGTKLQLLESVGNFRGLAIGADFGFSPKSADMFITRDNIQVYTLSASFGTDNFQQHISVMQTYQSLRIRDHNSYPSYISLGLSYQPEQRTKWKTKLMAEGWIFNNNIEKQLEVGGIVAGLRSFGGNFVWEIAFFWGPTLSFGGQTSSQPRHRLYPLPYISFMWFI